MVHENAGDWDLEVFLAKSYHWTPQQIHALDPDYVTELMASVEEENKKAEADRKKAEREAKNRSS